MEGDVIASEFESEEADFVVGWDLLGFLFHEERGYMIGVVVEGARGRVAEVGGFYSFRSAG